MTGELRRKLINDLINILEVDKKEIKVLLLLPKTEEQDLMFRNFSDHFNEIEFRRLGQERIKDSYNDCMFNCKGILVNFLLFS
jgi:hypothetical protein